jgi:hypothetical protein
MLIDDDENEASRETLNDADAHSPQLKKRIKADCNSESQVTWRKEVHKDFDFKAGDQFNDEDQGDLAIETVHSIDVLRLARFRCPQSLICPSWQGTYFSPAQNFSLNAAPKSNIQLPPSCPARGALAIVTNVGTGCGGRGSVGRARGCRAVIRERSDGARDERRLNASV